MSLLKTLKFIIKHPLNRQNKIKSIMRFVRWQIGSHVWQEDKIHVWIKNSKFIVKNGEKGLTGNIYNGLHEFRDMGFLLHYLKKNDLFIDVGANVGAYTILASAVIGANSKSFEPIPKTFRRLNDNIRLNYIEKKVECINKGVGDKHDVIHFTSDKGATNHVILTSNEDRNHIKVEVTTLDRSLKNDAPALIKIDVEGFEKSVLEGAHNVLKNTGLKAVIVELNNSSNRYGVEESDILSLMFDYGFNTYSYDPIHRTLKNLNNKKTDSENTLFLRDLENVKKRLGSAPKIRVHGIDL